MKRLDIEMDESQLVELLSTDPIGRNNDLVDFVSLLSSIEGGFSLFLDAEWGQGKTVFARQLDLLISAMNPNIASNPAVDALLGGSDGSLDKLANMNLDSFFTVYFNAWENDYWDDPLAPLMMAISGKTNESVSTKEGVQLSKIVPATLDAVLSGLSLFAGIAPTEGGVISNLATNMSPADMLSAYKGRTELRQRVDCFVDEVLLPERANKLLLIIDELDRCRPSFAVRLLEETKALFHSDRIVLLFSVNAEQLAAAVKGAYGDGINACKYLERFYDLKVRLRSIPEAEYMVLMGIGSPSGWIDKISREMASWYGMALRDMNRYALALGKIRQAHASGMGDEFDRVNPFARQSMVPVLLAVSVMEPDKYKEITEKFNAKLLLDALRKSDAAARSLQYAYFGTYTTKKVEEMDEDECEAAYMLFLEDIIHLIWYRDSQNKRRLDAYQRLGFCSPERLVFVKDYLD